MCFYNNQGKKIIEKHIENDKFQATKNLNHVQKKPKLYGKALKLIRYILHERIVVLFIILIIQFIFLPLMYWSGKF